MQNPVTCSKLEKAIKMQHNIKTLAQGYLMDLTFDSQISVLFIFSARDKPRNVTVEAINSTVSTFL